ncbi:unnamed protein product [Urochloa decumbens]|uniref:DUF7792 domain-containing protein n=1 Tax=Urochloa decumbens TaxID=240449 RepID=A0ABC9CZC2_9POAL
MEPVGSTLSTIFKLLQEIAKAAKMARRNRTRCLELARRTEAVDNVLRASKASASGDAVSARSSILCRLEEALDEAVKLIESCSRSGGLAFRLHRILSSGAMAARFDYVEKRITTCLIDLGAANGVSMESKIDQLAARDRHLHRNKPQKQVNAPPMAGSTNVKNGGQGKGGRNGGKGGKRRRGKKAAAVARPPPLLSHAGVPTYPNGNGYAYSVHHHSIEEDPTSCSVM